MSSLPTPLRGTVENWGDPNPPPRTPVRGSICRSVWRSVKGTLLNAPSLRSVRLPLYPLDSPPFCSPIGYAEKGNSRSSSIYCPFSSADYTAKTDFTGVVVAVSLCKGRRPLHPQPPLGTVDGFALQERECSQGGKGGDFRQKILPVP